MLCMLGMEIAHIVLNKDEYLPFSWGQKLYLCFSECPNGHRYYIGDVSIIYRSCNYGPTD